ncbi:Uncharacterised protein [Grimontia hollisae]|uniref:Uncharacterized protein n=1 Tax=Grimontia hollisae TaxID=673 RepID=A0A377HJN8_GRIHO|nr:Uncharacterised protein [Grimontia hollisae]STO56243.1 Uncharacterised protein [Grimontia hollisae]STQ77218.1 Uncharacterised protein [Grimontia hollisae]
MRLWVVSVRHFVIYVFFNMSLIFRQIDGITGDDIFDRLHKGCLLLSLEGGTIALTYLQDIDNDRIKE